MAKKGLEEVWDKIAKKLFVYGMGIRCVMHVIFYLIFTTSW